MDIESSSISSTTPLKNMTPREMVTHLASSNVVVVFSSTDCCFSTVAKNLLFSLAVGPTVIELDRHASGSAILAALYQLSGDTRQPLPAVFVCGKFLGGVEILLAKHINGALIHLLKEARALWL
ncbi:putative oxidoreductase [Medicago truncatula]|uniref:Putative oxidoreductase n=2 Tax=Medicago truncatula TaxID=3880 RepID=A0A396GMR6_MEDTR|nr:putative oxidoreductase [Medicago truncatula]